MTPGVCPNDLDHCALHLKFASITPNLIVRDIAKSTAFYRDVLGFTIKQTVPDSAPFVFVWLERDGVPVFLNDLKAAAHDYPDAAKLPQGGTAAMFFVITRRRRVSRRGRAEGERGDAAEDAVLRHARIRHHRSRRAHHHVRGAC